MDPRAALGLTEAQQADIRKNMEASRRERLLKTTDLKIASMDLRSLMAAEKIDEKAIAAKLAVVQAAQGALLKVKVDSALALKRILTPEQQKKMSEMRRQRGQARMHQRMNGPESSGDGRGRMGRGNNRMMPGMRNRGGAPEFDLDRDLDLDLDDSDEDGGTLIHDIR